MTTKIWDLKCTLPCTPDATRGQPTHLSPHPTGSHFVYTNHRSVVIRSLTDLGDVDVYREHSAVVKVAKYAPSGYYIASADAAGNLRIWDTINKEHVLKAEYQKPVQDPYDIEWDFESQRMVISGDGKERFAQPLIMASGASIGEVGGHSRLINTIALRPGRPFTLITGSYDTMALHTGPPFAFKSSLINHERGVNCIKWAPAKTADNFASVGMDGALHIYDAKGERTTMVKTSGAIYYLSWSPDAKQIMTSHSDGTVKFWDVANIAQSAKPVTEITVGKGVEFQQLSNMWCKTAGNSFSGNGESIASLSLSGGINFVDPREGRVATTLYGHQKAVTALHVPPESTFSGSDAPKVDVITSDFGGTTLGWDLDKCQATKLPSATAQVQSLATGDNTVFSLGMDDVIRTIDTLKLEDASSFSTSPASRTMAAVPGKANVVVYGSDANVVLVKNGNEEKKVDCKEVRAIACSKDIIVAGLKSGKLQVFDQDLNPTKTIAGHTAEVTCIDISSDGKYIASGDANRKIIIHNGQDPYDIVTQQFTHHTSRLTCLSFYPAGSGDQLLASGALDTTVYVWNLDHKLRKVRMTGAHLEGVNGVGWPKNQGNKTTVVSAGRDGCVRVWQEP